MQVLLKDVQLVFTNGMTNKGDFGYGYSFIVRKDVIVEKAIAAAKATKKVAFEDDELTPRRVLKLMSAKSMDTLRDEAADDPKKEYNHDIILRMTEDDALISVKAKAPVRATKSNPIPWFSKADILIDMYGTEYKGRKYISRAVDAGKKKPTVKVTWYAPAPEGDDSDGFDEEDDLTVDSEVETQDDCVGTDKDIPF